MSDSFEAFLGAGAFKRVFAYGNSFVRKYCTEGRLREDIAALWTAYSWGLPVALPLYYRLNGRSSLWFDGSIQIMDSLELSRHKLKVCPDGSDIKQMAILAMKQAEKNYELR